MKRFNILAVASVLFALTVMSGGAAGAASYQRIDGNIVDPILDVDGNVHPYSGPNLEVGSAIDCCGVSLARADLRDADLQGTYFPGVNLNGANLTGANAMGATWGDPLNVIADGVTADYANFENAFLVGYFRDSSLIGANFRGIYDSGLGGSFIRSDLTGANFSNADSLTGGFFEVNAQYTDFSQPYDYEPLFGLTSTSFSDSDFSYANFVGTNLSFATITNSIFTGARYSLNTVDADGNPVRDTMFPAGFDPVSAGMVAVAVIPEPSTSVLISLGLIGMSLRRRATTKSL